MDIYCHRCAEPWEPDSLHDAVEDGMAENYDDARRIFFADGCGSLFNGRPCQQTNHPRAYLAAELASVFGDDIDAIASMHEDATFIGWDRTPCCGATYTGTDDGPACRNCYELVHP